MAAFKLALILRIVSKVAACIVREILDLDDPPGTFDAHISPAPAPR